MDDLRAAMRMAEDEADAAAAATAEQEAAAELAEFTAEPPAAAADGEEEDGEEGGADGEGVAVSGCCWDVFMVVGGEGGGALCVLLGQVKSGQAVCGKGCVQVLQ